MAKAIQLGTSAGLQINVRLLPPSAHHEDGLAWAEFSFCVSQQIIWGPDGSANASQPLQWTLVDLLHGLARTWPWLMFEEGYPLPLSPAPDHPGQLMDKAQLRWEDMPPTEAEAEEDLLYDFRQRHDLSLLVRGMLLPPLWLLREGCDCVVWSPALKDTIRLPHQETMQTLTGLGDFLCTAVRDSRNPRAQTAVARWTTRSEAVRRQYLQVVSGLELEELRQLSSAKAESDIALAKFFELDTDLQAPPEAGELLIAARMSRGFMSLNAQRALLEHVKAIPPSPSEKIDAMSESAPPLDHVQTPFEQAYRLADWLRAELGFAPDDKIAPEEILRRWGITIETFKIPAPIDAVAVWGKRHGPSILLNRDRSSRASSQNGRRTTLAHEICHLLIDRQRTLPVAEVLGGQVARRAEQRANAFAAEFLLPRAQAAQACAKYDDPIKAAAWLEKHFRVSREVVCNQINNSDAPLDEAARRKLNSWKLETRSEHSFTS